MLTLNAVKNNREVSQERILKCIPFIMLNNGAEAQDAFTMLNTFNDVKTQQRGNPRDHFTMIPSTMPSNNREKILESNS